MTHAGTNLNFGRLLTCTSKTFWNNLVRTRHRVLAERKRRLAAFDHLPDFSNLEICSKRPFLTGKFLATDLDSKTMFVLRQPRLPELTARGNRTAPKRAKRAAPLATFPDTRSAFAIGKLSLAYTQWALQLPNLLEPAGNHTHVSDNALCDLNLQFDKNLDMNRLSRHDCQYETPHADSMMSLCTTHLVSTWGLKSRFFGDLNIVCRCKTNRLTQKKVTCLHFLIMINSKLLPFSLSSSESRDWTSSKTSQFRSQ